MQQIDRPLQELELSSCISGGYENEYEFSGNGEFGQAFEQLFGQEAHYGNNETFEMDRDPKLEMAYQLMEISNEYGKVHLWRLMQSYTHRTVFGDDFDR